MVWAVRWCGGSTAHEWLVHIKFDAAAALSRRRSPRVALSKLAHRLKAVGLLLPPIIELQLDSHDTIPERNAFTRTEPEPVERRECVEDAVALFASGLF